MYWTWVNGGQLIVHSGSMSDGFLGEIGLDGKATRFVVDAPGMFRTPAVTGNGRYVAYVGAGPNASAEVVVEARDASSRYAVAVFGPAAVGFDPTGDGLAFIGRAAADALDTALPVGPLRLLDAASGSVRTLLDGAVVAFFWAPDGRTIAALRVIGPSDDRIAAGHARTGGGDIADVGEIVEAVARGGPAPAVEIVDPPGLRLRLVFIDGASGAVRSQRTVHLTDPFVSQLLPFFDQYALSHRLWSPDSMSLVLPTIADDGAGTERPIVMPLSNPTSAAEAIPIDILRWTGGRAIVATGSPFDAVDVDGRRHEIGQANNVFIFPGVGLGAIAAEARVITDRMFLLAARTLADAVTDERLASGAIYPPVGDLRSVSRAIASGVAREAVAAGVAGIPMDADIDALVEAAMWWPDYVPYEPARPAERRRLFET